MNHPDQQFYAHNKSYLLRETKSKCIAAVIEMKVMTLLLLLLLCSIMTRRWLFCLLEKLKTSHETNY